MALSPLLREESAKKRESAYSDSANLWIDVWLDVADVAAQGAVEIGKPIRRKEGSGVNAAKPGVTLLTVTLHACVDKLHQWARYSLVEKDSVVLRIFCQIQTTVKPIERFEEIFRLQALGKS